MGKEIIKELIGRLVIIGLTIIAIYIDWRLALITPPLVFKIYNIAFCFRDRIFYKMPKIILDYLTHVFHYGYLVYTIILCNRNIDHWYSWIIAFVVWLVLGQLFGFLWPRRWHYEKLEGNL